MPQIFVSHSSADRPYAHSVAEKLRTWGYEPFVDFDARDGLIGGVGWESEVLRAVRESRVVLLCATETAEQSLWCFGEVLVARHERTPVIPLLFRGEPDHVWEFLRASTQYVDFRRDPEDGYRRLRDALQRLAPLGADDTKDDTRPPYLGLNAFSEQDASLLFGRERDLRAAISALQPPLLPSDSRSLVVVGASGSGKSSLMHAAISPALRKGAVPQSHRWAYVAMAPGRDPFRSLADAARRAYPPLGSVRELLQNATADAEGVGFLLSDLLAIQHAPTVCLLIDQLEELWTQADGATANLFMEALARASGNLGPDRFVLVATLRIDFLGTFLTEFASASPLLREPLLLRPLGKDDLARVIEGPARLAGIEVERELVTRVVDDASLLSDPLPLMSFVLRLMYDEANGRAMTTAGYRATGGIATALARHAEAFFERLPPDLQDEVMDSMVHRLVVTSSDGTAARRRASSQDFPSRVRPVIEALVGGRILVASVDAEGTPTVEFTHEAVLRNWPRLQGAIELADADKRFARRLVQAASDGWRRVGTRLREEDLDHVLAHLQVAELAADDLSIVVRSQLASGRNLTWISEAFVRRREDVETICEKILEGDDALAQYGLLTSLGTGIIEMSDSLRTKVALLVSDVEAVRRAAERIEAPVTERSTFVTIPGGEYAVGRAGEVTNSSVGPFQISRYLVTNLEFAKFVEATGRSRPPYWRSADSTAEAVARIADLPVVNVSYFDSLEYCRWLSNDEVTYRLPSEKEWECAFSVDRRGEQRLLAFPWGDDFDSRRCNTAEAHVGRPTPIGLFTPLGGDARSGVADLAGNVWEWTSSHGRDPDGDRSADTRAVEVHDEDEASRWAPRVQRGGTFLAGREFVTRDARLVNLPDLALQDFGMRLVRES